MNSTSTLRVYGRRRGRPLRRRRSAVMTEVLPRLQITLPLNLSTLFAKPPEKLWLEIGFGNGQHLVAQARANPGIGMLGADPFVNGVSAALDLIDRDNIENVRIFPDDARTLLDALPDACLDRVFVLFADPWPKARHAERRFIGPDNLRRLARVMRAGAELWLASDAPVLQSWMRVQLATSPDFVPSNGDGIHPTPPTAWATTRYEEKAIAAGRPILYFTFSRR